MKLPDSEKATVWVVVTIAVCALLWLIGIATASARTMSPEACRGISEDMAVIAEMRDAGKDQQGVAELVDRVLRPHLGEEDSYVQFETDITFMVGMVAVIYESKLAPREISRNAYAACIKSGYGVSYYANDLQGFHNLKEVM